MRNIMRNREIDIIIKIVKAIKYFTLNNGLNFEYKIDTDYFLGNISTILVSEKGPVKKYDDLEIEHVINRIEDVDKFIDTIKNTIFHHFALYNNVPVLDDSDKRLKTKKLTDTMDAIIYASQILKSDVTDRASKNNTFYIVNVIFNNPATIVFWSDGTKTVVKAQNETFDPEKGLAMAIVKKSLGNQNKYYNEIKKWLPEEENEKTEKGCFRCKYWSLTTSEYPCSVCIKNLNRPNFIEDK